MRILVITTVFLSLSFVPGYLLYDLHGVGKSRRDNISIDYGYLAEGVSNIDIAIMPEGTSVVVNFYFAQDGQSGLVCRELYFRFRGPRPSQIEAAFPFGNYTDITDSLLSDGDVFKLKIESDSESTYSLYKFRFDDVVSHRGPSIYQVDSYIKLTQNSLPRPEIEKFFTLLNDSTIVSITPNTIDQKVDDGFDHVKYFMDPDADGFTAKWQKDHEYERNIIYIIVLSTLFGIGLSGLIEFFLSIIRKRPEKFVDVNPDGQQKDVTS